MTKGVNSTMARWICEILARRTAEAEVVIKTIRISTTQGCPIEGVLPSFMWTLVVEELLNRLKTRLTQTVKDMLITLSS